MRKCLRQKSLSSIINTEFGKGKFTSQSYNQISLNMKVLIIGAGNLGNAFAADLSSRNHRVSIWTHPSHPGNSIKIANEGLEAKGAVVGHFYPTILPDLGHAVSEAEAIIVTIPAKAGVKEELKVRLAEHDLASKILIWVPGLLASLVGVKLSTAATFEASNSPYGCRIDEGKAFIKAFKKVIEIAAFDADSETEYRSQVEALFPSRLEWRANILDVAMHNTNFITHPVTVIENAQRILAGESFRFYRDGMTPSVCEKMEKLDELRMSVIAKFNFAGISDIGLVNRWYGRNEPNYLAFARNSPSHNATLGVPSDMQHRYLTEDCRMLPFYRGLAEKFGINAEIADWVLAQARALAGEDFEETGLTLAKLDMEGLSGDEIVAKWGAN